MSTVDLTQTYAVLSRIGVRASAIATHWLSEAAGCPGDTAKTRRFLVKLRGLGLVEGVDASRTGRVFWWCLTDAGRQFLVTFADRVGAEATTGNSVGTKAREAGRSAPTPPVKTGEG